MNYSDFDKNTGRLISSSTVPDDYVIPTSDSISIIGVFDGRRHYLDLTEMSIKDAGEAPSAFHYLSGMDGWVLDTNAAEAAIRAQRNTLLAGCDWVEFPSAKHRLSTEYISDWLVYRQALRDIPSQEGFPENVVWPKEVTNG